MESSIDGYETELTQCHDLLQKQKEKNEKLREAAADAYDWAVLHRIEMEGKGVWYRLKQALEKPDEMA